MIKSKKKKKKVVKLELFWGYRHQIGTIQLKRYFNKFDLIDAENSPFVKVVIQPFEAKSRTQAIKIITELLKIKETTKPFK